MSHMVSGVELVSQTQTMSCWYASSLMLQRWYQRRYQSGAASPETSGYFSNFFQNGGMRWTDWPGYARAMGFQTIASDGRAPTPATLETWLQRYGPIMVLGTMLTSQGQPTAAGHALVISGIEYDNESPVPPQMYIYDPWPPNVGFRGFHPYSWLTNVVSINSPAARRVSFVHYRE